MATEYPWGYAVFEIVRASQLVEIGPLDILLDDPQGGNGRTATAAMRAAIENGELVIEVDAPVVLEDAGAAEPTKHVRRGDRPVAFAKGRLKGKLERRR